MQVTSNAEVKVIFCFRLCASRGKIAANARQAALGRSGLCIGWLLLAYAFHGACIAWTLHFMELV